MKVKFEDIQPGDRVTINYPLRGRDKIAQQGTGKAVMRSDPKYGPGWVLNMGGAYGKPGLVSPANFVKAVRGKDRNPKISAQLEDLYQQEVKAING